VPTALQVASKCSNRVAAGSWDSKLVLPLVVVQFPGLDCTSDFGGTAFVFANLEGL